MPKQLLDGSAFDVVAETDDARRDAPGVQDHNVHGTKDPGQSKIFRTGQDMDPGQSKMPMPTEMRILYSQHSSKKAFIVFDPTSPLLGLTSAISGSGLLDAAVRPLARVKHLRTATPAKKKLLAKTSMSNNIGIDWSQAGAFVQDGTIFYSPNCSRTVVIPPHATTQSPFCHDVLDTKDFKQPVWWTDVYGWQSFIPTSPSYTASPFEPFCWMLRIIQVNVWKSSQHVKRYQMHDDDIFAWRDREKLLTEAAELIRIWFKIPGNMPPPPSNFGYAGIHNTRADAVECITVARNWLGVWMGFLSYLIARSKSESPSRSPAYTKLPANSPIPVWYHRLQETHHYPAAWLDGLLLSTVCNFDVKTLRAGVVFAWSIGDKTRPTIQWFLEHNIPLWFVWSKDEERLMERDRLYEMLRPPNDLIQSAMTKLFNNPSTNIPLASLVIRNYYNLGSNPVTNETVNLLKYKEAPSFVLHYTTKVFLSQDDELARLGADIDSTLTSVLQTKRAQQLAASVADADVPTQTMIEGDSKRGKLFDHWREFITIRRKRQEEIINVKTQKEHDRRLARERNPGVRNADMYTWEKIQSSGGKELYMHHRVRKNRNEAVFASYKKHQRLYNALTNEWDLCRDFDMDNGVVDSDSEDESEYGAGYSPLPPPEDDVATDFQHLGGLNEPERNHEAPLPISSTPRSGPQAAFDARPYSVSQNPSQMEEMDAENDGKEADHIYSNDVIEFLNFGYGYVPLLEARTKPLFPTKEWEQILLALGILPPFSEVSVDIEDKHAISVFFHAILKKTQLPVAVDDLASLNHAAIRHLFNFAAVHRPTSDLFIFSEPRSRTCNWMLGINHPECALYVCRYILSNPNAHTIVTVANRLLQRGIPFRTLIAHSYSARYTSVALPYSPTSFRLINHEFTTQDFETYRLQCQQVLSQPQGRAALLHGGIIWRIAKDFLSVDEVLLGPSIEVITHRVGYSHNSGTDGVRYCDDELTENELATICGTYSLYTATGQISIKSWFPPPICWTKDRMGINWVEWTARNEQFFQDLMKEIRAGKSKPKTVVEWTSILRGNKMARILRQNIRERARQFLDDVVPSRS
ncbi:hypothetical protein BJ912DRAFT_929191 [Pholiota molesta]|nr:hypothetical protein BJ912DRAFT_929191 [Pholiota molesta]